MMVRPEEISANNAPSANPLKTCETKLGQLIMKGNHKQKVIDRTHLKRIRTKSAPQAMNCLRRARFLNRSGIIAELAAEGIRRLHQILARDDFDDVVVVFLALHVLLLLTLDDDHRTDALMIFLAIMHVA